MIYITGDTHGHFDRVEYLCSRFKTTVDDILIINGDAGINTGMKRRDRQIKEFLSELPITLFCVHGNHEMRPEHIVSYHETIFHEGRTWWDPEFPDMYFAKDGEVYSFNGLKTLVIGGAYSVDKFYRLENHRMWFADEQPSQETKRIVESKIALYRGDFDVICSHTCPERYIPREMFLPFIDQSTVDASTEKWLDCIHDLVHPKVWYCSHFHTNKVVNKTVFLFDQIREFGK